MRFQHSSEKTQGILAGALAQTPEASRLFRGRAEALRFAGMGFLC